MSGKKPGPDRRTVLKGIGAAAGAGLTGLGSTGSALAAEDGPTVDREQVDVSKRDVKRALFQRESRIALWKADVESLAFEEAEAYEIDVETADESRSFDEVVVPASGDDATFDCVMGEDGAGTTATVKTESGTLHRATSDGGELETETLKIGDDVREEALADLEDADLKEELPNGYDYTLQTEDADAFVDKEADSTHLYVPAERDGYGELTLLVELDADGDVAGARALYGGAIDCFAECIAIRSASIGLVCFNTVCQPCLADPTRVTCAACAVCAGAIGVSCAVECGAEFLL